MAGPRRLAVLFWMVSLITVLSTGIAYFYMNSSRTHKRIGTRRFFQPACYIHSELCQLRTVLKDENYFGLPLSNDLFDFKALAYLKNSYIAQGLDLSKTFDNTADMRSAVETYTVDEYSFEAVKHLVDEVKKRRRYCLPPNDIPFTYSCEVYQKDSKGLQIRCSEYLNNEPTGGGSSLYGQVDAPHSRAACRTIDLLNGTYHLTCPYLPHLNQITINATFFSFAAFEYDCYKYEEHLIRKLSLGDLKEHLDGKDLTYQYYKNPSSLRPCSSLTDKSKLSYPVISWVNISDTWYWSNGQCYYDYDLSDRQKKCLNDTSILQIGDSHMLYKWTEIHKQYPWIDTKFQLTGLAVQLAVRLKRILKEYRATPFDKLSNKKHVIVLSIGHWDIHFLEVFSYITNMEDVFNIIKEVMGQPPNPRIIWIQSTPVRKNKRHALMKTSPIIAALNDWTAFKLKPLGVEILDAYSIAIPMLDKVMDDGTHFHLALGSHVKYLKGKVNVSGAILSVLFDMICR